MKNCPNCGGEVKDNAKFCRHCGNKIEQKPAFVFCEECGAKIEANAPFCEECGAKVGGAQADPWANSDPWADFADYQQPEKEIVEKIVEKPVVVEKVVEKQAPVVEPQVNPIEAYTERLSQRELDKLEGTDDRLYYVHRRDKRTERQLHKDFESYFNTSLFSDYTIETNVDASNFVFSKSDIKYSFRSDMERDDRMDQLLTHKNAKYCKPVNFLFKLGNRAVLAVYIAKHDTMAHAAVRFVEKMCLYKGIKTLHFVVGYPNTEHYVVRRVLEELGEIPYLYGQK